jgi:hypothetical protein
MRIALCFWGICRSTDKTIETIKNNIFKSLQEHGFEYDIFLHTYTLYKPYTNPRANENQIQLKNTLWKLLNPTQYLIEDQEMVDKHLFTKNYKMRGNPWPEDPTFTTFNNHLRALWSLKQVTELWTNSVNSYDLVIYLRPDVLFKNEIDIEWFSLVNSKTILLPNFQTIENVNDRFAIGHPIVMKLYGNRFDSAYEYSLYNHLHSEKFLAYILKKHQIKILWIRIKFKRLRANGVVCDADIDL